jgi:hypothetical protein
VTRRYLWSGDASGEGGPMLIADLEDYLSWGGAEERWDEGSVYRVHSYGPLTPRLPPRFLPRGPDEWHQNARVRTMTAAQAYLRDLIRAVGALEPAAALRDQLPMAPGELTAKAAAAFHAPGGSEAAARQEWLRAWRDHMEQGIDFTLGAERLFHVDLKPDTDYARGCDALNGDAVRISFGEGRQAVLWELEGGGTAHLALAEDQTGFLLLRTWITEEKDEAEARAFAEATADEKDLADLTLTSGVVTVVWSPSCPADHTQARDVGAWMRKAARKASPFPLRDGLGTIFRFPPGRYRVACGAHEAASWSCRWARFVLA